MRTTWRCQSSRGMWNRDHSHALKSWTFRTKVRVLEERSFNAAELRRSMKCVGLYRKSKLRNVTKSSSFSFATLKTLKCMQDQEHRHGSLATFDFGKGRKVSGAVSTTIERKDHCLLL